MEETLEIVEGSERDFGFVVREDGVFQVTVGYTAEGEKVKIAEDPVEDELARKLALASVYGDAWEPDQEAAFDELAAKHGLGGAAVRLRYPDWEERQDTYAEDVAAAERFEAEAAE